jgi:uncharacterized repeat protein (TIGR03803 family)
MSIGRLFATAALAAVVPLAANAGTFTTLYTFTGGADGGSPAAQLVYQNGALYGVTTAFTINGPELGNVFEFDLKTASFSVLYNFQGGTDGSFPADLISHGGMLYGTTSEGGINGCLDGRGCGTVFSLDPKTGKETVLYSFPDPGNGFQPDPGGLIYNSGMLYGAATNSGISNNGIIFAVNLSTGVETTVYEFAGPDGREPNPSLVFNNGLLYGMTEHGGGNSCGTNGGGCGAVFSVDPIAGTESILYAFDHGTDGFWPASNLVYHKGLFYGSTTYGGDMSCGNNGCGTAFSIDPSSGTENIIAANTGRAQVITSLVDHGASIYQTLYGTDRGLHPKMGELVKFDLGSGHGSVLHKFSNGADGSHPASPLTYKSGVYYGTTTEGAHSGCVFNLGCGTIFQYVP